MTVRILTDRTADDLLGGPLIVRPVLRRSSAAENGINAVVLILGALAILGALL